MRYNATERLVYRSAGSSPHTSAPRSFLSRSITLDEGGLLACIHGSPTSNSGVWGITAAVFSALASLDGHWLRDSGVGDAVRGETGPIDLSGLLKGPWLVQGLATAV